MDIGGNLQKKNKVIWLPKEKRSNKILERIAYKQLKKSSTILG
jgi:hypothetical protein